MEHRGFGRQGDEHGRFLQSQGKSHGIEPDMPDMPDTPDMPGMSDEPAAPGDSDEPIGFEGSVRSSRTEIERIQKAIDQLVVGGGGLERQDRLLARWRLETASGAEAGSGGLEPDERIADKVAFTQPQTETELEADSAYGDDGGLGTRASERERVSTGCDVIDAAIGGGLIRHGMHEWLGDPFAVSGTANGEDAVVDWVPCLGPVIGILHRLRNEHDALGRSAPNIAWIGRRCLPGPWNLVSRRPSAIADAPATDHGEDGKSNHLRNTPRSVDARLLDRSIFILPDQDDRASRRWCLETAIRTPAIDSVIVDGSAFDALDSRRIQLGLLERRRRGESAILIMVVRPPRDARIRSSASTRWMVEPVSITRCSPPVESTPARDSRHWRLRLVRCRMPQSAPIQGRCLEGIVSDDWPIEHPVQANVVETHDRPTVDPSIEKEADASEIRLDQTPEPAHGSCEAATPTPIGRKADGLFPEPVPEPDSWSGHEARRWNPRTPGRRRRTRAGGRPAAQCPTSDRLLFEFGTAGSASDDDARGGAGPHGLESVERVSSGVDAAVAIDASA